MIKMVFRAIAIGIALVAARQVLFAGRDLTRYNSMRAMSDDSPLGGGAKKNAPTNAEAQTTNPFAMLSSIPNDLRRYLKLKSM